MAARGATLRFVTRILIFSIIVSFATQAADLPMTVQQLIPQLGARKFAARQTAQEYLAKLGDANPDAVLADCLRAYAHSKDPEVTTRLRDVMRQLVITHILKRPRGFLGIHMTAVGAPVQQIFVGNGQMQRIIVDGPDMVRADNGIQVVNATADSPAGHAGVQAGDVITKIDDVDLSKQPNPQVLTTYVQSKNPGTTVKLVIQRGQQTQTLPVELGKMPENLME